MKTSGNRLQKKTKRKSKCKRLLSGILCAALTITVFSGSPFAQPKQAEAKEVTLSNPRIVTESSMKAGQKVTWDCIWFGSYPQAEVVPANEEYESLDKRMLQEDDLIKDDALYQALQSATGWDENGNVVLSGKKYRRIKKGDATFSSSSYRWEIGTYYHYFRYQPIKWRVLSVNGSEAFLLADKVLDDREYHTKDENVTWEGCTMRSWLNGYGASTNIQNQDYSSNNFLDTAFDISVQSAIKETTVENKDNLSYGTDSGNDTKDKVFLLSESEIYTDTAEKYGFVSGYDIYDEARRAKSSVFAKAMGTWSNGSVSCVGNCWWWLRSLGGRGIRVADVHDDGEVDWFGNYVDDDDDGVRPALNLNLNASSGALSSNLWSYAGTVCSDGTVEENGGGSQEQPSVPQESQPDEETYLAEHLEFIEGRTYWDRMKSTWAGVISKGLDTPTGRFGETMYNVLNTGSEILSCKRLKIFENPYDAVIMDLILDQSDVKLKDFSLDFSTEFSKNVSLVEKLCSMSKYKDDWVLEEEKYKTQLEQLIESPKSMKESNPAFYELCNKIFSSIDEKELDKLLNAYGKASQLQSALNTYANVVEWVADCIKFNSLVKAYIDTSTEFKGTLLVADSVMYQNMNDITKEKTLSRPQYVAFYEAAVNKYANFLTEDRITELLFTEYTVNGLERVADVFGNVIVKNATLYLSAGLGISKAAASWLYACIEAYKTGWRISEAITLNGENIECRELARASYYLEEALIEIVEDTATELLKDKKSIQAAKNFDAAYTILQDLECYALNNYARYLQIQQESFAQSVIQTIIHGVNFNKAEIEEVKALELEWKNACCHKDVKNSKDIGKVQTVTNVIVCCPTDVYVYDKEDNIVLSIENSIVTKDTREVSGETVGDIKLISLFDVSDYNIEIKATDNGSMSVVSDTYDLKEEKSGKSFSYIDIPIEKNTAYTLDDTHLLEGDSVIEPTVELDLGKDKTMVTSIALDKDGGVLKIGDEINIKASVSPADAFCPVVSWSTSDKDIAAVSEDGRLTAKRGGKVTVICSAIDGSGTSSSIEYNIKAGIYFESNGGSIKEPELYDVGEKVNVPSAVERAGYSFKGWYIDKELTKKFEAGVMPDQDIILYAGWTKNGDNNAYIPTVPSASPTVKPTIVPTTVPTIAPTPVLTETPEPTLKPTETPKATIKPSAKPKPSARPGKKDKDKTNSAKKIKKGSKVTDKKTKAVYKITGTGKNRTVEYAKSTKKNPASISVPSSVKLNGKNYKVTSVGKAAFKNNKKLKTVKLGKNVKKIGQRAFYGCTKLTNVSIGKNVTAIGANAFNKCTALTIITIPSKVNKIGTKAFYQCRKLRYFMVKTKKLTLENIGANAFGSGYGSPRVKTDKGIWKRYSNVFLLRGMSKKALFVIDPVKLVI